MKINFTLLILSLLCYESFSQKLTFDIFLFGNKLGQTVVERTVKNDSITVYTLNSTSVAHVFFTTRKTSLHYNVVYSRGQLSSSYSRHTRNDEVHATTVKREGHIYTMKRDEETFCIKPLPDCSTAMLFFSEPCNAQSVFSERLGENRPVVKIGEGIYEIDMKEGLTFTYRYKSGKLTELEMKKGLLGAAYIRPHL